MLGRRELLLSVLILFVLPLLIGNFFCSVFNKEKRIASYYAYGMTFSFAIYEMVGVPSVWFHKSFTFVYNVVLTTLIIVSIVGIIIRLVKKDFVFKELKLIEIISVAITVIFVIYFLKMPLSHQIDNADDSRFVVMPVDILETDRLFLTNPATGEAIENFILGDSYKDVCSPWALYIATLSKFTGVKVVTMAHTIMPMAMYVYTICVWWTLAGKVTKKENKMYQGMFVILILLMAMHSNYGGGSIINTVFMKFVYRIYEGKAILPSACIPMMYINMFDFFKKKSIKNTLSVLVVNLAMCFMSANGIVIGAIMIGCFALAYFVSTQNIKYLIMLLPLAIPNGLLYLLSEYIKRIQ